MEGRKERSRAAHEEADRDGDRQHALMIALVVVVVVVLKVPTALLGGGGVGWLCTATMEVDGE